MQSLEKSEYATFHKLKALLQDAQAPVTHRRVAAIIEEEGGQISEGANVEHSVDHITHAEMAALAKYSFNDIKQVNLMASGKPLDIKNALPCEACCKALYARSNPHTSVNLYFNNGSGKITINLSDIFNAYQIEGTGEAISSIKSIGLSKIDELLLTNITESLKRDYPNASLYITGSSAGFGGPKAFVVKDIIGESYWDIDLMIIHDSLDRTTFQEWFVATYCQTLNDAGFNCHLSQIKSRRIASYILDLGLEESPDFIMRELFWCDGMDLEAHPPDYTKDATVPSSIDLSVGKSLAATITPRYYNKKWYSRLA